MTLEQKKALVTGFLVKCNDYASAKLAQYTEQTGSAAGWRALELQDKIGHWTAYRAFNEYTIEELRGGELDGWFSESAGR